MGNTLSQFGGKESDGERTATRGVFHWSRRRRRSIKPLAGAARDNGKIQGSGNSKCGTRLGSAPPWAGAAAPAPAVRRRENLRSASFHDYPLAREASIKKGKHGVPAAGGRARQRRAALILGAGVTPARAQPCRGRLASASFGPV